MKQMTLARGGFEQFGKTTKRAAFLAEMVSNNLRACR